MQDGGDLLGSNLWGVVELRKQFVESHLGSLQLVVRLELSSQWCLEDVVEKKGQFARQGRIGRELRTLALEGSDGMGDVATNLRQLAEHGEL